jgi:hypothetical protein
VPRNTTFLVAEFSGDGLTLAGYTKENPGTRIDCILEPVVRDGEDLIHPTMFHVRGAPPGGPRILQERIEKVYGPVATLKRDDRLGTWIGRVRIRESAMTNPAVKALTQFQHRFGVPWTHIEAGVIYMRARVEDPQAADRLVQQVRGFMAQARIDADVAVQEIGAHDFSVWEELVQASVGMAP